MEINNIYFNASCEDILDELKTQLAMNNIPLLQKTRDSGNDIMVQCPYHGNGQERKPSAGIRKSDGMFHCFACGETHSLQEVISHCFGKQEDILGTFGWQWLNRNFRSINVEVRKDVKIDVGRNNVSNKSNAKHNRLDNSNNTQSTFVTEEELDKYRYYHPYWKKRGIVDDTIIELFDLGFDKTTNSITFPVRNVEGGTLFVARRSVQTKFFNYPRGVEKPLYGLHEITKYFDSINGLNQWENALALDFDFDNPNHIIGYNFPSEVFVCESMIDCILLCQESHWAVALNGLGNALQFRQLRNLPCRKLILATDNDKAGLQARKRIRDNVKNKLITEIDFPEGIKDIGECTKEQRKHILKWEVF